jgi:hypothetical protein
MGGLFHVRDPASAALASLMVEVRGVEDQLEDPLPACSSTHARTVWT